MSDAKVGRELDPIYHLTRCDFCFREVRSDKVIHDRENQFCSARCEYEYSRATPEERE